MYRLSPFTCEYDLTESQKILTPPSFADLIEGLYSNAVSGAAVTCTRQQLNFITPPAGIDCIAFLKPFTTAAAGYAQVVDGACGYCAVSLSLASR